LKKFNASFAVSSPIRRSNANLATNFSANIANSSSWVERTLWSQPLPSTTMKDSLQILDFKNSLQQVEMEEAEQLDNLALAK